MCSTQFAATETTTVTMDGHDYIVRHDAAARRHVVSCAHTQETAGCASYSPCGDYFIVESYDNPLGMAEHHHVNSATLEDIIYSLLA